MRNKYVLGIKYGIHEYQSIILKRKDAKTSCIRILIFWNDVKNMKKYNQGNYFNTGKWQKKCVKVFNMLCNMFPKSVIWFFISILGFVSVLQEMKAFLESQWMHMFCCNVSSEWVPDMTNVRYDLKCVQLVIIILDL